MYQPEVTDDLQRFFDRFLRGMKNDWDSTPRVRHSLLGFNRKSIVERPDSAYPPSYCEHRKFYLDGESGTMSEHQVPPKYSSRTYQSDSWDHDGAHFVHKFDSYTELIGFSEAELYMSCPDTDELDVYVICRKLAANGEPLKHLNIPLAALPAGTSAADVPDGNIFKYLGPNGRLRASHRRLGSDPCLRPDQVNMLAPATAWHPHDDQEKVPRGSIVCIRIPLWPSGMIFDAGESIRFEVKGHEVTLPEFQAIYRVPKNLNQGWHIVHTGPKHPSSITLSLAS